MRFAFSRRRVSGHDERGVMHVRLVAFAVGSVAVTAIAVVAVAGIDRGERWSDAATWHGAPPQAGAVVHIERGRTIVLDVDPAPMQRLVVDGRLVIADRDVRIATGGIVVRGTLTAGHGWQRFAHHLDIVLDGASHDGGALTVGRNGTANFFGVTRTPWVHLAATASAAARDLHLDAAPTWRVGDRIAIAPTGYDVRETEERGIVAIDGPHVRLDAPLRYRHWGTVTAGIDERAEVALLSHDIRIGSDARNAARGLGGQVIVTVGGTLHASGVAFDGLGHRGRLGGYPVHFHLAGDQRASLVENSSIVHSNNRCIAVHGSNHTMIRDNVAFDTVGHCYFLEDGIESGNTFEHNIGLLTRAATAHDAILPSDLKPATFWITNPNNIVRGNVAAGSDGMGFWYNLSPHPTGRSENAQIWPRRASLASFSENVAHANAFNGLFVDIERNPPGVTEAPNYDPPVIADFQHFASFKNRRRGAWLRGTKLRLTDAHIADNSIGVTFAGDDAILRDSLVVGATENETGPAKPLDAQFPIRGFEFYDGRVGVERTRFVNFRSNAQRRASALGTLQYSPFFTDPTNYAQGLSFENAEPIFFGRHAGDRDTLGADGYRGTVFADRDGSVTGKAGAAVVLDTPLLADDDCVRHMDWNALVCDASYVSIFIIGVDAGKHAPGPVRVRSTVRPAWLTLYGNAQPANDAMYQTTVRHGGVYVVTFRNGFPTHLRVSTHAPANVRDLTLIFPQAPTGAVVEQRGRPHEVVATRRSTRGLIVTFGRDRDPDPRAQIVDITAPPRATLATRMRPRIRGAITDSGFDFRPTSFEQ